MFGQNDKTLFVFPERRGVSANSPQRFVLYIQERKKRQHRTSYSSWSCFFLILHTILPSHPFINPAFCPLLHHPQALTGNIPHSHGLVQTGRHHQVLRWVELGTHHIVVMASQHTVMRRKEGIYSIFNINF